MSEMTIRPAVPEDIPLILSFIRELAAYEKMEDQVIATEELLTEWIFEKGKAKVNLAFWEGEPAGFTLYCFNFSTFLGRAGIWLEDLFVLPQYRGRGIGLSLMKALAKEAVDGGFGRFDFKYGDKSVLGQSLHRLFAMDGEISIYPGHGRASTLRDEHHTLGYFERY
jgi:GNAT superfamily N-acetyltransferase